MRFAGEYSTIGFLFIGSLQTLTPTVSAGGEYLDYRLFERICRLFPELPSPRIPGLTESGHQLWKSGSLRLPALTYFVRGDVDRHGTHGALLLVSSGTENSVLVVEMEGARVAGRRQLISRVPGSSIAAMDGGFQLGAKVFLVPDGGSLKLEEGEGARLEHVVFPGYRRELANSSEPEWQAVNLLRDLGRVPAGFPAEIRTVASPSSQVEVVLTKDGGTLARFTTNSDGALVVVGDVLYFTAFSQAASGMSLVAYDLRRYGELWRKSLRGLGPVAHSGYRNFGAHVDHVDGAVRVHGRESYGAYVEYVRQSDGETVAHKLFMHTGTRGSEPAGEHRLGVEDPGCIPGECICRGRVDLRARLNETGPGPEELADGVRCIVADYDGNGANDYALPGAEGTATVILSKPDGGFLKAIRLDAGGLIHLYRPRAKPGPGGEPASLLHGLFVPWVGSEHAVFLWTGEGFARTLFPAKPR
ncbi:MAG TPA: hypothetical protein VGQ17_00060 [Gemmatimonadales bacterium]|jgi:hypothetical protein|nr:hypothetical protein [Gemmatimonadales bacterium]